MAEQTTLLNGGREWMLFVDGENLTKRGQRVITDAGGTLAPGPAWRRDVFLWTPREESARFAFFAPHRPAFMPGDHPGPTILSAGRAYYYTCTESNEPEWTDTRLALRARGFEPRLFRRARGRSKAVDVALTTEVLTLGAEGRYEVAVLFAGDGDYVPLVEAVKRMGLHVVVGFFTDGGLSPELRIAADDFIDISGYFSRSWGAPEPEAFTGDYG